MIRSFILLFLLPVVLRAETITVITSDTNSTPHYSDTVVLAQGDFLEVIFNSGTAEYLEIKIGERILLTNIEGFGTYQRFITVPKIAGPAEIRVQGPTSYPYEYTNFTTFKITRANTSPATVPSTAVVIPQDEDGQYEVILESSTDMITWTVALPGTYGGDTVKRFFRTRIVKKPSA